MNLDRALKQKVLPGDVQDTDEKSGQNQMKTIKMRNNFKVNRKKEANQ